MTIVRSVPAPYGRHFSAQYLPIKHRDSEIKPEQVEIKRNRLFKLKTFLSGFCPLHKRGQNIFKSTNSQFMVYFFCAKY